MLSLSLSGVQSKGLRKQSGFTLIELMVVMAIIAILATAGLSAYTGYIKKARDSIREQDMQKIYQMLFEYNTIYGGIPITYNGGRNPQGYTDTNAGSWDNSSQPVAAPTFMSFLVSSGITEKVPVDPINNATGDPGAAFSGYTYFYFCYTPSNNYSLGYIREKDNSRVYFKQSNSEFSCL